MKRYVRKVSYLRLELLTIPLIISKNVSHEELNCFKRNLTLYNFVFSQVEVRLIL